MRAEEKFGPGDETGRLAKKASILGRWRGLLVVKYLCCDVRKAQFVWEARRSDGSMAEEVQMADVRRDVICRPDRYTKPGMREVGRS